MNTKSLLFLLPLALASMAPAAEVNVSVDIHLGRALPPPPPEIIVIENVRPPGPPPSAPANGYRRNHTYYYYPGTDVYFRPEDRMWFYLEGPEWRAAVSLPPALQVDFGRSVALTMETDRPYQFHSQVRTYYPADYFVTKVKVKDAKEEPGRGKSDAPEAPRGNGPANNGRGNGRGRGAAAK